MFETLYRARRHCFASRGRVALSRHSASQSRSGVPWPHQHLDVKMTVGSVGKVTASPTSHAECVSLHDTPRLGAESTARRMPLGLSDRGSPRSNEGLALHVAISLTASKVLRPRQPKSLVCHATTDWTGMAAIHCRQAGAL
jgi:hypothetical protein